MTATEKLICQRNRIEEEVKLLQNQIRGSCIPSTERVKKFETDLQHHYQEYQRVYSKLLSTLPASRYDELDEDSLHFDAIHTDACVLVETLMLSYPSTGNPKRCTQTPSPTCFPTNRTPRRRIKRFRSRSPSTTMEQPVPTVAHQEQHPPNPTDTSQKDSRFGEESSENVTSNIDVSPSVPFQAFFDDNCAIAESKSQPKENHQTPPPREKPTRDNPMAKQFPSPPNKKKMGPLSTNPIQAVEPPCDEISFKKINVPPNPKRSLLIRDIPPMKQPIPKTAGTSRSTEPAQASTSAHLVSKPFQIPAGASSVVDPLEKLWIIADPQFEPPPICVYEYSHPDLKPKKPPDGQSKHHQPSEVIPEYVSRTHPSRNPEENAQYNPHLLTGPVFRPMPATMSHVYQETPKLTTPPEDTVIRMPVLRQEYLPGRGQYVRAQTAPAATWSVTSSTDHSNSFKSPYCAKDASPHTTASTSSPWQQLREGFKLLSWPIKTTKFLA